MGRLENKVAFITGGAGSIGAATARLFAEEGARVVVADLDEDGLASVTDEIGAERAAYVVTDVTDSDAVREAIRIAVERFGGLDIAFANAGIFGEHTPIVDYPEDVFDAVMAVNVRGSFLVAKHALAVMRDGGSLIFNSSVVGLFADAGIVAYATSKHAVVGLMRTAASEVADRGIRVNSLHPGPVDNGFQHSIEVRATGQDEARAAELFEERIPLGRHATPREIAYSALFLASDESAFVTSTTMTVDGGVKG
jgi:NAD(P)-dependent dehydrogenase (short-subunit alcohol dehydrogenase family)